MKCGILCDGAKNPKKTMWENLFKVPVLTQYDEAGYHIAILYLPYTIDELSTLPAPKMAKLWVRAANMLVGAGVEYLYLPDWCGDYESIEHTVAPLFKICDGNELMIKIAHAILARWMTQSQIQPDALELGLYRRSFNQQSGNLLLHLSSNLKYVTLFCDDEAAATVYAENVFMQTGLCVAISKNLVADHRRCGVIMLLDPPEKCKFSEHQTIIDLSGSYHYYCINTGIFTCPSEFLPIKMLFDGCDQRFAAFVLESAYRSTAEDSDGMKALLKAGLKLKSIAYVKRKQKPA